jgi:hypothetical protein
MSQIEISTIGAKVAMLILGATLVIAAHEGVLRNN